MYNDTGCIVRSMAGHDKGDLFYVVGTHAETALLLLVDGKRRKLAAPKQKKCRHVEILSRAEQADPTAAKLRSGEAVSDRELRRALSAFKGGNHAWQKTI